MNENSCSIKTFINGLLLATFWILIFLNLPLLCHSAGHNHDHHHHRHDEPPHFKYSKEANLHNEKIKHDEPVVKEEYSLWGHALTSTLLISAAPFLILFLVPLDKSKEKEHWLKMLLSFASGGLLGDAFLHLIPHALTPHHSEEDDHAGHSHSDGHGHGHDMTVGVFVLLGILSFLVVEKLVRLLKGGHGHSHGSKGESDEKNDRGDGKKKNKKEEKEAEHNDRGDIKKKGKNEVQKLKQKGIISVSGYLNLAADFIHNFTDGLAIGASYLAGKNIGIVTTFTILVHEVPHEIGDFAILIQSGCSRRKAMGLQLITAVGALIGTVVSLLAEGAGDIATSWILPFTAGGFIYISTVSIIPELLEDTKFVQSIKEIIAMLIGVGLMVFIAKIEEF